MKKGLVSVFIPSYNYQRYLGDAIDSILAQTYRDWELIIVDDASADDSPAIIQRYQRRYPERIRCTLLERNVGQSEATNVGLRQAQGEFVALLAADDIARPERLAQGVELLRRRPEVAAAFSRVTYIDGDGHPLPVREDIFNRPFEDMRWQLLEGNFLCGTSIVARIATMQAVGGYNRILGYVEDYDLWLRLLDRHELVRVDDVWVDYRLHGENLSFAASRKQQRLGPLYESVAVAVRAMHRWPLERLHRFRHHAGSREYRREAATVQIRLAQCCLTLERNFLAQISASGHPSPALGVAAAYGFLLDALQNDPDNVDAQAMLPQVYRALGDQGRAEGSKSSTLAELATKGATEHSPASPQESTPISATVLAPVSPYQEWFHQQGLTRVEAGQYDRLAVAGGLATRFHIATILPAGQENALLATLKSLTAQFHHRVLFTVVATADAPPGFTGERLRWLRADATPLATVNQSLLREDADWVGLIACGDQLVEAALLRAAEAIDRHPEWQILYADDDRIGADGTIHSPRLKPDFDLTLLEASAYAEGLVLTNWKTFASTGGFAPEAGTAASLDLLLRLAERGDIQTIGHLAGPQIHRQEAPTDMEAMQAALERHFRRLRQEVQVAPGPLPDTFRIAYSLRNRPLVSLIIPTRDRLPMLSRCLESILEKTDYGAYEIIVVDHDSMAADTRTFLAGLAGLGEDRVRVLRQQGQFSLASLMNAGAREARGTQLLFLHDDVAALHPDWLERMVAQSQRPGVGAVGARLLSADGRLQHAGIVLGLADGAELVGSGRALDDPGELGRYVLDQEVAAVSAACLLVRREAFDAVGGFDEAAFPVFLPEVDLGLRLTGAGWRTVWTPQASLFHNGPSRLAESIRSAPMTPAERRQGWTAERDRLQQRSLIQLARDPHYSRLYSLRLPSYRLCTDPLLARDPLPWRPLPRILVQPADRDGCGYYRLSGPLLALAKAERIQGYDTQDFYTPVEFERIAPNTLVLQRPYTEAQLAYLEQAARYSSALRLFDLDDLITCIPEQSANRRGFPADVASRLKRAAKLCHRLIVSTPQLAMSLASWHEDIRIVPNHLPSHPWKQLQTRRRQGDRPRVGWAGAVGHEGDLALIADVIAALAREVDWVFLGHCPEGLRQHLRELHPPVPITDYPAALAALDLNVAIAPLEINAFNEAKSSLKILEYGVLGYPVVCTDIMPYQGEFPVNRVRNRPRDWVAAIRALAHDPERSAAEGDQLRQHILAHWMLEDHLDDWYRAWTA